MNLELENLLDQAGVQWSRITKSEKVGLLRRWRDQFAELLASSRHGQRSQLVATDQAADRHYRGLQDQEFYLLPNDSSGMSSCRCRADSMPDLTELVSDTITDCDEIIVIDVHQNWSAAFVNHGSAQMVGRHFQDLRGTVD